MFWRPYVSAAERRQQSEKMIAKMRKSGIIFQPVCVDGRKIAKTFWGQAWCDAMDSHADYSNRLPRGRTYVRNGSVIDLVIESGLVRSKVQGSSLYEVEIKIEKLSTDHWKRLRESCSGAISSALELLKGKFSNATMSVMTHSESGLFPKPREISFCCSCPDSAALCKHIAATLYGVGNRLDTEPELLFKLRGVDPNELITNLETSLARAKTKVINADRLGSVFGIDLEDNLPEVAMDSSSTVSPTKGKNLSVNSHRAKDSAALIKKSKSTLKKSNARADKSKEKNAKKQTIEVIKRSTKTKNKTSSVRQKPAAGKKAKAGARG